MLKKVGKGGMCTLCGKYFTRYAGAMRHLRDVPHRKDPKSGLMFFSTPNKKKHIAMLTGIPN